MDINNSNISGWLTLIYFFQYIYLIKDFSFF
jgi:hypothetical protein